MAVVTGEALATLRRLPTASVDAILTDPPYDLTNRTPDVLGCAACGRTLGGRERHHTTCPRCGGALSRERSSQGRGFMGARWDGTGIAFNPELWSEALRVIKPGGHLLAFGGTRTSHRMVCAIEDAGWEIRDSIYWLYGTGMPKSASVSKHLDKAAGHERPVVGTYAAPDGHHRDPANRNKRGVYGAYTDNASFDITAPVSEDAQTWEGWGSAMKPSHEPICLARAPFKGTLAANVVAHGTGALHIDACRVGAEDTRRLSHAETNGEGGRYGTKEHVNGSVSGRWPANTILQHTDSCELLGIKRIKGANVPGKAALDGTAGPKTIGVYGVMARTPMEPHTDPDGMETVESWQCDPACPVAELDRQSGGSSRFFYVAKPSKAERNHGLDDLPDTPMRVGHERLKVDPRYDRPPNHIPRKNIHPTVKPVTLLRYLARLITPPGGLILDIFNGSGSTGLACIHEGYAYLGIEMIEAYADISRRRIAACPPPLDYNPRLSDEVILALLAPILPAP